VHRRVIAPALAGCLLAGFAAFPVAAASSTVECGQLAGYAAPDAVAPTDGSISLGLTPDTWVIAATATVSAAAAAQLPTIVNSAPTCVALDLDDGGIVTSLDFAANGQIVGSVTVDGGSGWYIVAGRLFIPTDVTDAYPGLAAIVATSADAGTTLTLGFTIDTATGALTGFNGQAAFCGQGDVDGDGNGLVGDATIPASVLDAADRAALAGAGDREACADVESSGTIDPQSGIANLQTDVTITVAGAGATARPTVPPTSTRAAAPVAPSSDSPLALLVATAMGAGGAFVATRRRAVASPPRILEAQLDRR
jgi:hypothetical protein